MCFFFVGFREIRELEYVWKTKLTKFGSGSCDVLNTMTQIESYEKCDFGAYEWNFLLKIYLFRMMHLEPVLKAFR